MPRPRKQPAIIQALKPGNDGPGFQAVESPGSSMVEQGMRFIAAEHQQQEMMAARRPRKERQVLENAIGELNLAPEFAKTAYYVIPYQQSGRTVNVEGPSIKAAMALARRWGNCANGARVVDDSEERMLVEGVFLDYETNTRTVRSVAVSRYYIPRETKIKTPLNDQRMTLAIQAGMSKAVRNAILAALPAYLVDAYYQEARRLAAGGAPRGQKAEAIPLSERMDKMYRAFSKFGITKEAVDRYIQANWPDETHETIIGNMIGIYNGIAEGQVSAEMVFGGGSKPAPTGSKGSIKLEDTLRLDGCEDPK